MVHAGRAAVALMIATSCRQADVVELRLLPESGLDPDRAFGDVTVTVRDVPSGHTSLRAIVPAGELGSGDVADLGVLEPGGRYVVEVVAQAPEACPVLGRAVGQSLVFEHREGGYEVPVAVGCADELSGTRSLPNEARLGHVVAATAGGKALVAGGAREGALEEQPLAPGVLVTEVEEYDPVTGGFTRVADLLEPALDSAPVVLANGELALAGGATSAGCASSVQLVSAAGVRSGAQLSVPRCGPSVARLEIGILVAGLDDADEGGPTLELLDAGALRVTRAGIEARAARFLPRVVPIESGTAALIVGGAEDGGAVAERLRADCGDGEPCSEPLPGGQLLPDGLAATTATFVPCAQGGGVVYVIGGGIVTDVLDTATADVWCYPDLPGEGALARAGALPEPRSQHVTVLVGGSGGAVRLLVLGGELPERSPPTALLATVQGCACGTLAPEDFASVPLPPGNLFIQHAAAVLEDGTVLVVGGTELLEEEERGTRYAAIFHPDRS